MKKILGLLDLTLAVAILSTANLFAQQVIIIGAQGYTMVEDVEGDPALNQQYFLLEDRSNTFLDGSPNYYTVSFEEPINRETQDAFGIKVKGTYTTNDTIRRVVFKNCGGGIYCGPWAGGGGLIDDCSFIENKRYGIRTGKENNHDIEIRNCRFQSNQSGIRLKAVEDMWIHHNSFVADTVTGIMLQGHEDHGPSRNNVIENNYLTGHRDYGIEVFDDALNNTIRENKFINDPIRVDNADSNLFIGNFITDCDIATHVTGCVGNVFESDTIANSTNYDIALNNASEVTFIASIFDTHKVNFLDSESKLFVSWYLDVTVTNGGPIEGAIVKCYNKDGSLIAETTTGSDGKTDTLVLPQFVMDSTTTLLYTPYSVVTSKEGYGIDTTNVDLTKSKSVEITLTSTGVAEFERMGIPHHFALKQNYPNPFNPSTQISYQLPKTSKVILKIYSINGQLVNTLLNEFQNAGEHTVQWDGKDMNGKMIPSGIYIYSLIGDDFAESRRMVLLR